jgi:hypothetical protein
MACVSASGRRDPRLRAIRGIPDRAAAACPLPRSGQATGGSARLIGVEEPMSDGLRTALRVVAVLGVNPNPNRTDRAATACPRLIRPKRRIASEGAPAAFIARPRLRVADDAGRRGRAHTPGARDRTRGKLHANFDSDVRSQRFAIAGHRNKPGASQVLGAAGAGPSYPTASVSPAPCNSRGAGLFL